LKSAENMLWQGKVEQVINLFKDLKVKPLKRFAII
jgi:hypothetical protein